MRFAENNPAFKLAVTVFLVVIAASLAASGMLLRHSAVSEQSDSIFPDKEDLKVRFGASPLEAAIHGNMGKYLRPSRDRDQVIEWLRKGGERTGFYEKVEPILARHCLSCHGASSTVAAGVSLVLYSDVQPYSAQRGPSTKKLIKQTHIHLFGIGSALVLISLLVSITRLHILVRAAFAVLPLSALLADVACWWWIRVWDGAAHLGWFAGLMLFVSAGVSILLIMVDLWLPRSTK